MAEEEQEISYEEPEEQGSKKKYFMIGGLIFLALAIGLGFIASNTEDFDISIVFWIFGGLVVLGGLVFLGFNFWKKALDQKSDIESEKIPQPASRQEVRDFLKEYVKENMETHIRKFNESRPYNINGHRIIGYKIEINHKDAKHGFYVTIVVSANYLEQMEPALISGDATWKTVQGIASNMAGKETETEKSSRIDPMTGQEYHYEKQSSPQKDNKSKSEDVA